MKKGGLIDPSQEMLNTFTYLDFLYGAEAGDLITLATKNWEANDVFGKKLNVSWQSEEFFL